MFNIFHKKELNRGFTLVEIMISTAIFVTIMVSAIGSLLVSSETNKKSEQLRLAMDNVNFAVESMTRTIRMGSEYSCGGDLSSSSPIGCAQGDDSIAFKPSPNMTWNRSTLISYGLYYNSDYDIYSLKRCDSGSGRCIPITSETVNIEDLKFFVNGVGDDQTQPSVLILIKGTAKVGKSSSSFAIQTLASQRSSE
jgi:Tfp pilus assembly protein PilW